MIQAHWDDMPDAQFQVKPNYVLHGRCFQRIVDRMRVPLRRRQEPKEKETKTKDSFFLAFYKVFSTR